MPPPVPPEQKIKMLYHCVKVAGKPDMDELGKVMGLSKAAAEARYTRMMKSLREEYEGLGAVNGTTKTTKTGGGGKKKTAAANKRKAVSGDSDDSSEGGEEKKVKSEAAGDDNGVRKNGEHGAGEGVGDIDIDGDGEEV